MHSLHSTSLQISLLSQKQVYLMYVRHPSAEIKETLLQISDYHDLQLGACSFSVQY